MSDEQSTDDRIESLQARVDAHAAQLRLLWGLFLYGCATLVVGVFEPELVRLFGLVGFFVAVALALRYAFGQSVE
jgi:hypothetical protein